jgi:hypothetical protein
MTNIRKTVDLLYEAKLKVKRGEATDDEVMELLVKLIDQLLVSTADLVEENQLLKSELENYQAAAFHNKGRLQ